MKKSDPAAKAKPETAPDFTQLARILTLHNYANSKRGFINEHWATKDFEATYKLAYAMCEDEVATTMGFEISYNPARGDHIHAMYDNGHGSSTRFHRQLALSGELAKVFEQELHALAMVRAIADQKRDEDELLRQRAQQRLNLVLTHGTRLPPGASEGAQG